jgi:hypothetical protein
MKSSVLNVGEIAKIRVDLVNMLMQGSVHLRIS